MSRTSVQTIAGVFTVTACLVYAVASYLNSSADFLLPVGVTTTLTFAIVDLLILGWVIAISPRLPKVAKKDKQAVITLSNKPLPPLAAARTAAFALAGTRVGSLLAGGYFGLALVDLQNLHAVAYSDHAKRSLLTSFLAIALIGISIWLERKCSPPKPDAKTE